jgi:membrane protein
MFTEMIKCEFKQLQKPLKLVSTIIAIMTVTAFLFIRLIFLISGIKSTSAIILWYIISGIVNLFCEFIYPVFTLLMYIYGGDVFYRSMYSTDTSSANKLILSKFIPMVIFQIAVRVEMFVAAALIMGEFDSIRYGYGYGISFSDIVNYSEFYFMEINNGESVTGLLALEVIIAKIVGIFATTLLLWLCVSIGKSFKKAGGVIAMILFIVICILLLAESFTGHLVRQVIVGGIKDTEGIRWGELDSHIYATASILKNAVLTITYYLLSCRIIGTRLKRKS